MLRDDLKVCVGSLVAIAGLVAGLCACGNDAATEGTAQSAEPEAAVETSEEATAEEEAGNLADRDATVYSEAGEPVTLTGLAAGKPLVINFWATWCPYCVEELPDFEQIVSDYDGRVSFAFVDAVDGEGETVENTKAWLGENGHTSLPVYYDNDFAAGEAFAIYAYPTTVIVDANGKIVQVSAGRIDPVAVRQTLDSLQ